MPWKGRFSERAGHDFGQLLVSELDLFVQPVRRMAAGPEGLLEALAPLGWDLSALPVADTAAITSAAADLADAAQSLIEGTSGSAVVDLAALSELLNSLRTIFAQFDAIADGVATLALDPAPSAADLGAELVSHLAARYLRIHHPPVYAAARLLRLLEGPAEAIPPARVVLAGTTVTVRAARPFERLRPERLPDLLANPAALLGGYYLAGGLSDLQTAADVEKFVQRLWKPLGDLVFALGGEPSRGVPDGVNLIADDGVMELARSTLRLSFNAGALGSIGVRLTPLGAHRGGPRLIVSPFGSAALARSLLTGR